MVASDLSRGRRRSYFLTAGVIAAGALVVGAGVYAYVAREELSPVARGERLAHASGCFACHGHDETEHRANFRRTASGDWRARGIPTLWENGIDEADVLVEWISLGCPPDEREKHEQLFIQMPAYADRGLDARGIDDVAAWILAQGLQRARGDGGLAAPPASSPAGDRTKNGLLREGDRLSRLHGCYQCHGELGQGGVPNPGSLKDYIPGFFGADFLALTDGGQREEILHWIDHGRGRSIERGPLGWLARRFFDGQTIGMPAYRDRLSDAEKTLLVEFLLLLQERGSLDAHEVEALAAELTDV